MDSNSRIPMERWLPPWGSKDRPKPKSWPNGFRTSWIEVDLDALGWNLSVLRSCLSKQSSIAAVVKDNAYGHGMVPVARYLQSRVEMLAVAILEEGIQLRKAGIQCPILVLNGLWPGQEAASQRWNLVPAIGSGEELARLEEVAASNKQNSTYHLKLDTGMHRWGLPFQKLGAFLEKSSSLTHVRCEGVLTHLACADETDAHPTRRQIDYFSHALAEMSKSGQRPYWVHAANSAGVLYWKESHFNLVRPGISLYGYDPRGKKGAAGLRPVLSLKSRIAMVKEVQAGDAVGYGYTFVASKSASIAVIPVGYGDGFSRFWSNRGKVLVRGRFAPVVGRVSMDAITIDISGIPKASVGEEVILLGRSRRSQLWADDLAEQLGTIPYEILTALSPRLGRIYRSSQSG